ncbi:MAG TPA: phosphate-starvation-inducible PsiE family protein [Candidatus Dormibacteraeota bacterium]|nr:phosphate-starvation-inducible PsiE family protein [Candidatus Dormibacteraeota bacterium]
MLHTSPRTAVDGRPVEALSLLQRVGMAIEIALYVAGGFFLVAAAVIVLIEAVPALWQGANPSARVAMILDRVLLVFVLVEVFHTLRFAIARQELRAEPFLVVALIAAVRRFLVITAGTSPITQRDSLVELGLLLLFMVASAYALYLVRPRQS